MEQLEGRKNEFPKKSNGLDFYVFAKKIEFAKKKYRRSLNY